MSSTTLHIPWPYTLFVLYFEPLSAFLGSLQAAFIPAQYLKFFTPHTYAPLSTNAALTASIFQIPLDQVAACYVLFAWNEAVTLRVARNDIRVWKAVLAGIAVCDMLHLAAAYRAMGAELFLNPRLWRMEDWVNMMLLGPPLALRIAFLMEVGVRKEQASAGGKAKVG